MEITLQERTADYVRIYFERTQDDQIDRMLPRSVNSLDQALENFAQTKLPNAKSYGKTIYSERPLHRRHLVLLYRPKRNSQGYAQLLYF